MKKKHLGVFMGLVAILGAVTILFTLHEPTRKKVVKSAKVARKSVLKVLKEKGIKLG